MKIQSNPTPQDISTLLIDALTRLNQIGTAIIRTDDPESNSLQLIANSLIGMISNSAVAIYTFDQTLGSLKFESGIIAKQDDSSATADSISIKGNPRQNGFGARAISRRQRSISYEEAELEIRSELEAQGVKVEACFPLLVATHIVGLLYIYLFEDRKFSEIEEMIIAIFANHAGMAIYHWQHLAEIKSGREHKDDELNRLRRAGLLISSRLRLEETLESILELALEISNAQYGIFRLLDKSGEFLVTRAVSSLRLEKPLVEKLPLNGKSIMAHVARTREPLLIQDLRKLPWSEIYYPLDSKIEMRSELAVPLINASGRLEGVLNLESPLLQGFSEDDSHLLQSLATYAITAIQEVRLLDALQESAQLLISQPSQQVLDHLCEMANELLNTSSSAIWLANEKNEYQIKSSNGPIPETKIVSESTILPNSLLIPLRKDTNALTLGMFGVFHSEAGQVKSDKSEWDKKVLACLANYAVLAIQNETHQLALRSSQERHLIAETFAAVGDISANLLHNVNNKVGTIPVRIQSIQDKYNQLLENDSYLTNSLKEIETSAMAAMQIVQENLSYLRPIRMENVQLALRISDAIRSVQIPQEIHIKVSGVENLPLVNANSQNLTFVFKNLIENAIDALHRNGEINILGSSNKSWVEVSVTDNGPGISAELQEQIFELEFSNRAQPGKMGFGLWWVKTWMTRLGGSVSVVSDGRHGTTFTLRLPIADDQS